ncbi:tRNA lysidine(34) synthetase TilS [Candidatus Pelagibacter sp.]|nr:tRNA lysidine(34) synthetase TilS [Candidatus Pelagibacter sp.]
MTAKNKVNNKILSHLKDKELSKIYKNFNKFLKDREINSFTVSLSGGPDSLALAYFSKCFELINNKKVYYVHIDHKIRKNSTKEAKDLKYFIKKYQIKCEVFSWKKNKKMRSTQKNARIARYSLLEKFCKKKKINALLLAHHQDDVYENFFIRMLRGSGIKGLTSFSSKDTCINKNLKVYRPFLDVTKETLLKVTNKVFGYFIDDPSNYNNEFLRIRIRNLLNDLKNEGFNKEKFDLTYCNLHSANETLKYYSDQNILKNTNFFVNDKKNTIVINSKFFKQPNEIVLRSLSSLISKTNRKYYPPRGKIMLKKINEIRGYSFKKTTVGGCIIERVNNTTLIYPENTK